MPQGRPNSYAGGGFIKSMREKHEPHMKLAGRVEGLEKNIPIALAGIHKTSSKSFGLQRKTLLRVIALEKKVSGITIIIEGLEDAAADAVKKPPRKKRPPKKSAKKPTPKDWGEEVPGDWDATSGSGDAIPEDEIGGAIDGIDDSVDDTGGEDVIDVPTPTAGTPSTSDNIEVEIKQVKQETKKIHSTISTLTSHTRTNLSKILGVQKRVSSNEKKITLIKNILKSQQSDLAENLKGLDPVASPLEMSIQNIVDSVRSIHDTLIRQQDLDKGQEDDADIDAEQDKRDAKESGREGGGIGEGLKKTGEKMLAPVKKGFGSIMDWIKKFLMAKALMMFFNWFSDPANAKKVSSLFRFIKDWWPAILTGLLLFAGSMLGPAGIIIGITALVVGFIPKIVNSIKSLFGFTKDVNKEAAKGEKEAAKAEKIADKQDKKDVSESLKPDDDVGAAPEPGTQQTPDDPVKMNKGGQVPGQGDKDTVPAMLTPGEFVMSKGAVEQYGVDTLEGMNAAAGGTNKPKEIKPGFRGSNLPGYGGGGSIQSNKLFGYSGGGEVVEEKKDGGPKLNKTTGKLARRIEPLITGQDPKSPLMSLVEKHPMVMMFKGIMKNPIIQNVISGVGKALGGGDKEEPDLDLKEAIEDLQNRFNYSIYDGNYKMGGVVGSKGADGSQGSAGASGGILDGFISAVSSLPIVGKPLAKASGLLVTGVEQMIDQKLQLSGNQSGTATPNAPTKPTTTVAYKQAQSAAQGGGGGGSTGNPGGKVPNFSASAKLSKQKIKVLGISR